MASLVPLSELHQDRSHLGSDVYDPTDKPAFGRDGSRVGKVRSALVEPDTGKIRYLIVDTGSWFNAKEVLIPVGLARTEDNGVFFDSLTKEQVRDMREYRYGEEISYEHQTSDEDVLRGSRPSGGERAGSRTADRASSSARYDYRDEQADSLFTTPQRLRLLEERLVVHKRREHAGEVTVSKHVETHPEQVSVTLSHDEVTITRHPGSAEPIPGAVVGSDSQSVQVELEAERAEVRKQAYVAEEVEIRKRSETEAQTVSDQVSREVLDVEKSGHVHLEQRERAESDMRTDRSDRGPDGPDKRR
ncbi:uncharacterized protein (TIGR02271 family) [Deinobacterium chartae]|uniref:Uncharacterized protein (TIGR02271 family) n=1 Tax=Deinobacterium chartae TaxID=521158 RepID=A0A841I6U8_9DEIO|nr:DUF2382 domain-containing protein [Deinobacterium chartae]MBB6099959.1 uncharacterized protein (TIGR02271 family) [Deinobacterium chartae]